MEWPPDKERLKKDLCRIAAGLGLLALDGIVAISRYPEATQLEEVGMSVGLAAAAVLALPPLLRMANGEQYELREEHPKD